MGKIPVALQMYTVRDAAAMDFDGTLRKVADLGYPGVELAGTGGLSAPDLKSLLDDLNLKIAGTHVSLAQMETDFESALDYYSQLGVDFITCPFLPEDRRQGSDAYKKLAAILNSVGQRAKERGIQLCYHNHAFEFERFGGETGFDILFKAADPDLVKIELDVYWVEFAGESAVAYLKRYAERVPLVHIKDMTGDGQPTFAEVGEGRLDFQAIFEAAESAPGVAWYIVEQDKCQRPSIESAQISLENLKKWGKA